MTYWLIRLQKSQEMLQTIIRSNIHEKCFKICLPVSTFSALAVLVAALAKQLCCFLAAVLATDAALLKQSSDDIAHTTLYEPNATTHYNKHEKYIETYETRYMQKKHKKHKKWTGWTYPSRTYFF
jgi:hypothetical protein